MLEENATVIAVYEDRIEVESITRSSCSKCSVSACSSAVLSQLFRLRPNIFSVQNTLDVKAGSQVVIGIPDSVLVKASLWAYFVPVLSLIFMTLFAVIAGFNESQQALCGLIGLGGGFLLSNKINHRDTRRELFEPVLLRELTTNQTVQHFVNPDSIKNNEVKHDTSRTSH